jgi:VanZ family protein
MGLIFLLSGQSKLPTLPTLFGIDKVQHIGAYAVFGLLLLRATALTGLKPYIRSFIIGALYGASDEFHQSFVPGRDMSGFDWLADVAGLAIALLAVAVIDKYLGRGRFGRRREGI